MEKPYVLHMITPEKNISPFDANMAFDAGWQSVVPYTNVTMEEIQALVQDSIFSRYNTTFSRKSKQEIIAVIRSQEVFNEEMIRQHFPPSL